MLKSDVNCLKSGSVCFPVSDLAMQAGTLACPVTLTA